MREHNCGLQNCVDLPDGERGSCSEMFVTSAPDRHQLTFIKVEDVSDSTEEDEPETNTAAGVRTEPEVSCILSVESISQIPRIIYAQSDQLHGLVISVSDY
jgi:hypothetical protein